MNEFPVLSMDIETCLSQHIEECFSAYSIDFPSSIPLRDYVFEILDRFCTVVYFPLYNEKNNGFHIKDMPFADGKKQDFVFINTAQTTEKQVFTAAHELGHIWKVDDFVVKTLNFDDNKDIREKIINRFAAVFLMPQTLFEKTLRKEYERLCDESGKISGMNLLKLIVLLMNHFLAPQKAVVLRMVELGYIGAENASFLIYEEDIEKIIQGIILELGFQNLRIRSEKKWIDGLAGLLDAAEAAAVYPPKKIDHLRRKFSLEKQIPLSLNLTDALSLNSCERYDINEN